MSGRCETCERELRLRCESCGVWPELLHTDGHARATIDGIVHCGPVSPCCPNSHDALHRAVLTIERRFNALTTSVNSDMWTKGYDRGYENAVRMTLDALREEARR